jgi:DNA-binding winged helix-turn-helix (wHTH) protein/tetratricopeptide (TPR) repeat protein
MGRSAGPQSPGGRWVYTPGQSTIDDNPPSHPASLALAALPKTIQLLDGRTVDLARGLVHLPRAASATQMTTREQELVTYLALHRDRAISRDELLERVWGYSSLMKTRAVDIAINRVRKKLETHPRRPRHILTVHGKGYRLVGVKDVDDVMPAPGPPQPAARPQGNLKPDLDPFFGRQTELALLRGRLAAGDRLVTLLGPPGMGRSRLARELLGGVAGRATSIDASGSSSPQDLTRATARSLGIPANRSVPDFLATQTAPILLLEGLPPNGAWTGPLIGSWLQQARELVCIVVSERRLQVAGETTVDVGPLAPEAARALFVDRALRVRPDLAGSSALDPHVAPIAKHLDGVPLAIELTVRRLKLLDPAELAARMKAAAGPEPGSHAARSLRAAMTATWQHLGGSARACLIALAAFEGGCSVHDADTMVQALGHEDMLETLLDHSVVRVVRGGDQTRLSLLHSTLRYASAQATAAQLERRSVPHAEIMLARADDLGHGAALSSERGALQRLALDRKNLWKAYHHIALDGDLEAAVRVLGALSVLMDHDGMDEGELEQLDALLSRLVPGPLRARVLEARGRLARIAGGALAVLPLVHEGLRQPGLHPETRFLLGRLQGRCLLDLGRFTEAQEVFAGMAWDPLGAAWVELKEKTRANWALAPHNLGRQDEARRMAHAATSRLRAMGATRALAIVSYNLAAIGDADTHLDRLREATALFHAENDRVGEGTMRSALGVRLSDLGRDEAIHQMEVAISLFRASGDRQSEALSLVNLASILNSRGQHTRARAMAQESLLIHQSHENRGWEALAWVVLACSELLAERNDAARTLFVRAQGLLEAADGGWLLGLVWAHLAALDAESGALDSAVALFERARQQVHGHPALLTCVELLEGYLDLARDQALAAEQRLARADRGAPSSRDSMAIRFVDGLLRRSLGSAGAVRSS